MSKVKPEVYTPPHLPPELIDETLQLVFASLSRPSQIPQAQKMIVTLSQVNRHFYFQAKRELFNHFPLTSKKIQWNLFMKLAGRHAKEIKGVRFSNSAFVEAMRKKYPYKRRDFISIPIGNMGHEDDHLFKEDPNYLNEEEIGKLINGLITSFRSLQTLDIEAYSTSIFMITSSPFKAEKYFRAYVDAGPSSTIMETVFGKSVKLWDRGVYQVSSTCRHLELGVGELKGGLKAANNLVSLNLILHRDLPIPLNVANNLKTLHLGLFQLLQFISAPFTASIKKMEFGNFTSLVNLHLFFVGDTGESSNILPFKAFFNALPNQLETLRITDQEDALRDAKLIKEDWQKIPSLKKLRRFEYCMYMDMNSTVKSRKDAFEWVKKSFKETGKKSVEVVRVDIDSAFGGW